MNRKLIVLILIISAAVTAEARLVRGTVVAVIDGDTITVRNYRGLERIRLIAIDAPEREQAYGAESRTGLLRMLFGKTVRVVWKRRDRNGRIVGRVLLNRQDFGLAQVQEGRAWYWGVYARSLTPSVRARYERAAREARAGRAGLWAEPNPTPPWEFRRKSE